MEKNVKGIGYRLFTKNRLVIIRYDGLTITNILNLK